MPFPQPSTTCYNAGRNVLWFLKIYIISTTVYHCDGDRFGQVQISRPPQNVLCSVTPYPTIYGIKGF